MCRKLLKITIFEFEISVCICTLLSAISRKAPALNVFYTTRSSSALPQMLMLLARVSRSASYHHLCTALTLGTALSRAARKSSTSTTLPPSPSHRELPPVTPHPSPGCLSLSGAPLRPPLARARPSQYPCSPLRARCQPSPRRCLPPWLARSVRTISARLAGVGRSA